MHGTGDKEGARVRGQLTSRGIKAGPQIDSAPARCAYPRTQKSRDVRSLGDGDERPTTRRASQLARSASLIERARDLPLCSRGTYADSVAACVRQQSCGRESRRGRDRDRSALRAEAWRVVDPSAEPAAAAASSRLLMGHPRCCLDRRRERAKTACPVQGLMQTSPSRRSVRCRERQQDVAPVEGLIHERPQRYLLVGAL